MLAEIGVHAKWRVDKRFETKDVDLNAGAATAIMLKYYNGRSADLSLLVPLVWQESSSKG